MAPFDFQPSRSVCRWQVKIEYKRRYLGLKRGAKVGAGERGQGRGWRDGARERGQGRAGEMSQGRGWREGSK